MLVTRDTHIRERSGQLVYSGSCTAFGDDERADPLAVARVRVPDYCRLLDSRLERDELFHLARADVQASADDDVALAAADAQVAFSVQRSKVLGDLPTVGLAMERLRAQVGLIEVLACDVRPAALDLADMTGLNRL